MIRLATATATAAMAAAAIVMGPGLTPAMAQTAAAPAAVPAASAEPAEGITVLFETGSARIGADQGGTLDLAARTFRDGNPVVMIVTGTADTIGDPSDNLDLSIARARSVADGLVSRGIPIERLQVLGQGNSDLPVVTEDEVPNADNRSANITWR